MFDFDKGEFKVALLLLMKIKILIKEGARIKT